MEDHMAVKQYKGKKSLKQPDEFITFSSRLLQQVIKYKNQLMAALSVVVVLVLAITAINYFSQKSEDQSLLMLSKAISRYQALQSESGDVDAYNGSKDALMNIKETYGNKTGGKLANFFLANCSFAAGEYESSATLYRQAATDFEGVFPFETLAKSSLGYALAQQGDHEAAMKLFEEMTKAAAPVMSDELLFALSRQYAATGKTDLQQETVKKLIETYPESIYTNVIREKFPDLIPQSES